MEVKRRQEKAEDSEEWATLIKESKAGPISRLCAMIKQNYLSTPSSI
jgi:hypothetical protein